MLATYYETTMSNQSQRQDSQNQSQTQAKTQDRPDPAATKQLGSNDPHSGKQQMQGHDDHDRKGRPSSAPHNPDLKSLAQPSQGRDPKVDDKAAIRQQREVGRNQSDQI